MFFILDYWYLWVIGLIVLPVITVLPHIRNIHAAIDRKDKDAKEIAKMFLNPVALAISIMGGMGTFVAFVFFFLSIIFAIIRYVKA